MNTELQAEVRDPNGRTGNRTLRRSGKVPAIVYGAGKGPQAIALDHNVLLRQMAQPAFYTSILTVKIGSEAQSVVVKEVQRHPSRPVLMHLDFQRIVADQALTLNVPIRFIGGELSKGVKEQGGAVEQLATDIEVSCLPKDLPDHIDVDISHLELNQILHLSDLTPPEGVIFVALEHQQNLPVVTISPPRREEAETSDGDEDAADAAGEAS